MRIDVITLFPELIDSCAGIGVVGQGAGTRIVAGADMESARFCRPTTIARSMIGPLVAVPAW